MTTVRPQPRFSIIRKSTRARLTQRSCKVSVDAATDVTTDVSELSNKDCEEDADFCGEPFADNGELLSSLTPLLFSMKLFGLYFRREVRRKRPANDAEWNPGTTTGKAEGTSSTNLRVYATVILILVWINTVRFATMFTREDQFGAILLMKITMFTFCVLAAIFQTTYYYANHTGKLLKILITLPVTRDCVRSVRRSTVGLMAFIWVTMIANFCGGSYLFFTGDEKYNFVLAPFVTYIYVPKDKLEVVKVIGYFGYMSLFTGFLFAHSMNLILVYTFYCQYKKLKKNFSRALGKRGQFNGNLSLFRRRHQTLSRAVSKVDGFMRLSNVAGFVCHIINTILLLYSIIFYGKSMNQFNDIVSFLFWLIANIDGLLIAASAGVIVNHMVCMCICFFCICQCLTYSESDLMSAFVCIQAYVSKYINNLCCAIIAYIYANSIRIGKQAVRIVEVACVLITLECISCNLVSYKI